MRTNGHGKPVVALDIDGTLGDYHGHFISFCRLYFDRDFPDPKEINTQHFSSFLGLTKAEYREAKLAYRQGGWKRWMPAYPGASLLTQDLRQLGAEVWICTTRPYLRLDSIDPDTREWLRRNGVQYDAVLFDTVGTHTGQEEKGSKYDELYRQAGDRVVAIVDDMPEYLARAERFWPAYEDALLVLMDQPYNRNAEQTKFEDGWKRVRNPFGIMNAVRPRINRYLEVNSAPPF